MRLRKNEVPILLVILIAFALIVSIPLVSNNANPSGNGLGGKQPDLGFQTSGIPNYNGFLFPYTYQQPSVPKSVGVQGIAGPNVPLSEIGVTQQAGPVGHLGPVNITDPLNTTMAGPISSVSIQIFNQTLQPQSSAYDIGATVSLQNISLYKFYTGHTGTHGYANFTLSEGWYYLIVGQSGSHMGFSQEIYIGSSVFSITRYAMPSSSSNIQSIGNGASGNLKGGSFYIYSASGYPATGVAISVHNGSKTGPLTFSGITDSMGFVNYTGLSDLYSYYYTVDGYGQPSSGVVLGYTNTSGSFNSGSHLNIALYGKTAWTASVSGTAPRQGYVNSITLSTSITFTGGQVYLSAPLTSQNYQMKFVNTRVYFNSSVTYSMTSSISPNLYFINSTVIMLSNENLFGSVGSGITYASFNNTVVYFSTLDNSAIPYTTTGKIVGPYLEGSARNSIFEEVHNARTNSALISGSYSNSEFYRFNMTESNPPNPISSGGITHFNHVYLLDSNLVISQLYIDNSVLNRIGYVNVGSGLSINQSFVDFHLWNGETGLTLGTVVLTHDTIRPYAPTSGIGNAYLNPSNLNVTYTLIDGTPSGIGIGWYGLSFAAVHSSYYNDYVIDYPNISIRQADVAMLTTGYTGWGGISFHDKFMNMSYTQLYGMDSIGFAPPQYFNLNFSHTNFSNGWSDQEWNPFEWFTRVVLPQRSVGTFNNCTFYGMHFDPAIWLKQWKVSTDVSIGFFQDLNQPNPPSTVWGYIYMNYSRIYNVGIGTNGGYSFAPSEGGIATYFDHNVFYNDPSAIYSAVGSTSWYNGSYFQVPIATNIQHSSGLLYMTNNWFLNLTNQTVPVSSLIGSGGQGTAVSITLANNHFFYYPNKLQTYIPTFSSPPTQPFNSKRYIFFPGGPQGVTQANYSYEIPMRASGQFSAPSKQDQYVFNSSILQSNPYTQSANSVYAYVIEPDVNTTSGRPVVSYSNGLVGGLQPNFTWNGSTYQLAVESNMTFISTASSSASSIGLQFQVPIGFGALDVWMYNSSSGRNQLVKSISESGSLATVSVAYDPASMPADAVFFTNTTAQYSISFNEVGLTNGSSWSVSVNGVTSSSTTDNITFLVQNGSYSYEILSVPNYKPSPNTGTETVKGSDLTVPIIWSRTGYIVSFNETGLTNKNWTVVMNGNSTRSSASSITYDEPNGTYSFTIVPPTNYTANITSGNVTIKGTDTSVQILFSPDNSTQVTNPSPQPPPPSKPPTTSKPPSGTTTSSSSTGYKRLIIELVSLSLAPSLVMTFYFAAYVFRERHSDKKSIRKIHYKKKRVR